MLFVVGLIALALLFLIPVGASLLSNGHSRRRRDSLLVGIIAGAATVGLVSVWIAVIVFFIPGILTTSAGFLIAIGVVIAAPVATIRLTRGWLRRSRRAIESYWDF